MRFALIGTDEFSREIALAFGRSTTHSLVVAYLSREEADELDGLIPDAIRAQNWESLLARPDVDAVIVASGGDALLREEQLKRLVQDAIPLLVVHPACDVMFAYELEMMRREAGGVIVPVAPDWWHPGFDRLCDWRRHLGPHSRVEQVTVQRSLADRSRDQVLRQFVRDVWPIRRLIGPIANVSAVGAASEDVSLANLNVHCSGENGVQATWSVLSPTMDSISKISIVTANEMAAVQVPGGGAPWILETRGETKSRESLPVWDCGLRVLDRMQQAVAGELVVPSWSDACLDLEAADSVKKSLRRKRTVDLHTLEATEDQNFKGYMAAAGCLILVVILIDFLVLSVIEGFRMPLQETPVNQPLAEETKWSIWLRLWPVYPLVAFLLLQFLLLLAKRPSAPASNVHTAERL